MITRFWRHPRLIPWRSTQPPPSDASQLGEAARRLLDDPTLQLALDRVQANLFKTWGSTGAGESQKREAIYQVWWGVEELKAELRRMLSDAHAAERKRAA